MANTIQKAWQVLAWPIGILVILLLAFMVLQRAFDFRTQLVNDQPQNTFPVTAQGKVKAVPDTAVITLGVFTQGSDARRVQQESAEKINTIIEFAKSLGIPREDITTSQSGVQPQYNYERGTNTVTGYQSSETITVKVRGIDKDTTKAEQLTAGALENGANQIYGSQFVLDNPDDLQQEARRLAIAEAKQKAQVLAAEAGIKLGKVVNMSESGQGPVPPVPYYGEGRGGAAALDAKAVSPSVEPGQQEIVQSITLYFEIK